MSERNLTGRGRIGIHSARASAADATAAKPPGARWTPPRAALAWNGTKPRRRNASAPRTAFNVAYERIKSEILAFRLKPLAPLSEGAPATIEQLRNQVAAVHVDGRLHIDRMAAVDAKIHAAILRAAGLPKLSALVDAMNEQAQRMRCACIEVRPRGNRNELLAILDALERRDTAAAEAAMRAHIGLSRESLAKIT